MKTKIVSIIVFVLAAYVLPLMGKVESLRSFQVLVLVLIAAILLLTQPPMKPSEAKKDSKHDKYSVLFILLGCLFTQVASVTEWAYFGNSFAWKWDLPTIAGLSLIIGGTAFRLWSIRTLGKFFTATVKTQDQQRVIRRGAYAIIRHPSYLGAYLAIIGSAVFLHAFFSAIFSAILMFIIYRYRIDAEETTLVEAFGDEYKEYQLKSARLIPYLY
jgi:protein-S-isoprenylcysteine O-methyltransferase Ste14